MCVFLAVAARQALVGTIVVGGCAYTRDELEKLKIPALKNLLHQAKLPTTAPKKAGLIDRLWNNLKVEMPAPVVELQAEGERVPAQEEQVPTMPTDGEQMVAQGGGRCNSPWGGSRCRRVSSRDRQGGISCQQRGSRC